MKFVAPPAAIVRLGWAGVNGALAVRPDLWAVYRYGTADFSPPYPFASETVFTPRTARFMGHATCA